MNGEPHLPVINHLPVDLDRDKFVRTLLRELTGTLQDVVGLEQASGFVSIVGQQMGDKINEMYRSAADCERFTADQVAQILVDLKQRIGGDFFVVSQDDDKIILGNRRCPFGDHVARRPSLCMMTSNVFGLIAAENLGYARVLIEESIARGNHGCRVVIYLRQTPESRSAEGREYFSDDVDPASPAP